MSHTTGAVLFADGTIKYVEWNGTCDCIASQLYDTKQELSNNWRKGSPKECTCGQSEPVEFFDNYGHGNYYKATGCKSCNSIEFSLTDENWQEVKLSGRNWADSLKL